MLSNSLIRGTNDYGPWPSAGAVSKTFLGSVTANSQTTYAPSSIDTSAYKVVVAEVAWRNNQTLDSATIGGRPATIAVQAMNTLGSKYLGSAIVIGSRGSSDVISLTFSGSVHVGVGVYGLSKVQSYTASDTDTGTGYGTDSSITTSVTGVVDGAVFSVAVTDSDNKDPSITGGSLSSDGTLRITSPDDGCRFTSGLSTSTGTYSSSFQVILSSAYLSISMAVFR